MILLYTIGIKVQNNVPETIFNLVRKQSVSSLLRRSTYTKNLPKQPVPPLQNTLKRYLKSVIPFLNERELTRTRKIVHQFGEPGGIGEKLQKMLEKRAEQMDNWLTDWWIQVAYLSYRDPLCIFSNPGQVLPFKVFNSEEDRLKYTANIILGALQFRELILSEGYPQDRMGKIPLDMSQYKSMFGTCRIPGEEADTVEVYPPSKHIVVAHNNHWFRVEMYGNNEKVLSKRQLRDSLRKILLASNERTTKAIGIFTSEHRDKWAEIYEIFMKDATNKESIKVIQTAIFVVCLDNYMHTLEGENRQTMATRQFLHGGGSRFNTGNRWYDKTIQFIIGKDGTCGICFEHSQLEHGPMAKLADYVVGYAKRNAAQSVPDAEYNFEPQKLIFNWNEQMEHHMHLAEVNIDKLIKNLEVKAIAFSTYGHEYIMTHRLNPDSFIQMALQYTFYKIHNKTGGHYEAAGLRMFKRGRAETIRSTSVKSINFAKTMMNPQKTDTEKIAALRVAVGSHKKYSLEAITGRACDMHLFGLRQIAVENGLELPSLFKDDSYKSSKHWRIASHQLPTYYACSSCFAPAAHNGYAVCYTLMEKEVLIGCSAFTSEPTTCVNTFLSEMQNYLGIVYDLIAITSPVMSCECSREHYLVRRPVSQKYDSNVIIVKKQK